MQVSAHAALWLSRERLIKSAIGVWITVVILELIRDLAIRAREGRNVFIPSGPIGAARPCVVVAVPFDELWITPLDRMALRRRLI